jgi:NADPH:quinone reductase-like Zn-dependent oxidoreductase
MKAFTIDRYKSKDGGRIVDMPQPKVGDNDVLVQVHAAGVNLLDAKIADGEFKLLLPYRFPLVLGNDVAGVVVQVGARVRRFKPGDEVYAQYLARRHAPAPEDAERRGTVGDDAGDQSLSVDDRMLGAEISDVDFADVAAARTCRRCGRASINLLSPLIPAALRASID